jgi:hypothetical protein
MLNRLPGRSSRILSFAIAFISISAVASEAPPAPPTSWHWISQEQIARAFSDGAAASTAVGRLPLNDEMRGKLNSTIELFRLQEEQGKTRAGKTSDGRCLLRVSEGELGSPIPGRPIDTLPNVIAGRGSGFAAVLEIVDEWAGWSGEFGIVSTLNRARIAEVLWTAKSVELPSVLYVINLGRELVAGGVTLCREVNDEHPMPRVGDKILFWGDLDPEKPIFARGGGHLPIREDVVDLTGCAYCRERIKVPMAEIRAGFASRDGRANR